MGTVQDMEGYSRGIAEQQRDSIGIGIGIAEGCSTVIAEGCESCTAELTSAEGTDRHKEWESERRTRTAGSVSDFPEV